GLQVLRYGGMREQLLGVEAVNLEGELIGRVPALHKDNTGYRWEGLLAGSEGTLAVVTRAHVRLVPSLPDRVGALCAFDDLEAALGCCAALRQRLDSLLALEAFFAAGLALVREHATLPAPFPDLYAVYVLVECGGRAGSGDLVSDALGSV